MEEELGKEDAKQYNIKQGPGGLVDIDFLAQYLLLRHGRQRPRLQVPGTMNALKALKRAGILGAGDADRLCSAYLFLRKLESRMRVVANLSMSTLAREPERIGTLARRMGYEGTDGAAGRRLLEEYEGLRAEVRALFDRLLVP
jgi:glutamate-ammonia-ligase adenylyltransferase